MDIVTGNFITSISMIIVKLSLGSNFDSKNYDPIKRPLDETVLENGYCPIKRWFHRTVRKLKVTVYTYAVLTNWEVWTICVLLGCANQFKVVN